MAAPVELGYLTIPVQDITHAKTFFGAVFGWEFESGHGADSAHIANTRFPLGITKGEPGSGIVAYFRVNDIEAVRKRVMDAGGTAGAVQSFPSGLNAPCTDGMGARFDLWQPAPGY